MFYLSGITDYFITDFQMTEKTGAFSTMQVTTSSDYYYNFKYETGKLYFKKGNKILFVGVIDKMDYNFNDGTLVIYMTEYIGVIAYTSDLLGTAPAYDVTYTAQTVTTVSDAILLGTDFTMEMIIGNLVTLEGSKLTRKEWLELLQNATECGRDATGDYTVNPGDIVSDKRKQDIIVNYDTDTVIFGVKGCYRPDITATGYVWIQKKLDITNYILKYDELSDKVFKTQRIVVIGKDPVYGSAYITTATDVPVEVIVDESCQTNGACEVRAASELNLRYKNDSLGIEVDPNLYYNGEIEVGMQVTITTPVLFKNDYNIVEINIAKDKVTLILGSPVKRLLTSLTEMNERIKRLEKW